MRRKFALAALLLLVAVTALALVVAPVASAKAETMTVTASEAYAAPPNLVAQRITGNIAHLTFDNALSETSACELIDGLNYTHMNVVTPLVGGSWLASTRGICYGSNTFVTDTMGVWKGTFAGTISMAGGTYNCAARAKGRLWRRQRHGVCRPDRQHPRLRVPRDHVGHHHRAARVLRARVVTRPGATEKGAMK